MLTLPFTPSLSPYRFTCPILNESYIFDVRWNARALAWYFDLREVDETPIALGIKVVIGAYLGRKYTHTLFQSGVFVATDTSGQRRDAGFDDLGDRVRVMYAVNGEVAAGFVAMLANINRGQVR